MMPLWTTDGNVSVKAFARRLKYPLLLDYASTGGAENFSVVQFVQNWLNNHEIVQFRQRGAWAFM